ncbi:unnamed protein product [Discula destructiva]
MAPIEAADPQGQEPYDEKLQKTASAFNSRSDAESQKVEPVLDAFGDELDAEIQYKTMHWWQATIVMIAENISLGILSLPAVLATNGLIAGLIALIGMGLLTTYAGYVLWEFRMRYPQIASYTDIGEVLGGRIGKEIMGFAYVLFCTFCMASHLLTFSLALNVLSSHGTCTLVFGFVGLILFVFLTVPRTLKGISSMCVVSAISIMSAVIIVMVALGINPKAAYEDMVAVTGPTLPAAFNGISNIVFAYAGHVAWVSFISELREPRDFPKALFVQQGFMICAYVTVSLVIYRYAGNDVASPALGSASPIIRKVAYGVALPTILIAGVIFAHVNAKYIFLRLFKGTPTLHSRGLLATGSWIGIGAATWTIAWIIAESIPVFSDLLGFVSALLASWFSFIIPGFLWLYMNKGSYFSGAKNTTLTFINVLQMIVGLIVFGLGLYSSGYSMATGSGNKVWSCADNSL